MRYDNSGVRRQNRLPGESRVRESLAGGEYGGLSLAEASGPCGLPSAERMEAPEPIRLGIDCRSGKSEHVKLL